MTNTGALAANLHEGSRSEYLAQFVFASFGTAVSVPHQEDAGIDLYCTMTEQVGHLAWPRHHYTVQVKSTMSPWRFGTLESVSWLIEHPLPLFLCVVDKSTARLRVYHTLSRFLVWVTGAMMDSLELVPDDIAEGHGTEWTDGRTFHLSAPVLDMSINDLLNDERWLQAKSVLEFWLRAEERNLARVMTRLPIYESPAAYTTNSIPNHGTVFQWNTQPARFDEVRATLGELLSWLGAGYEQKGDLNGMARAALLLRYLCPEYEDTATHVPFVQSAINVALGLGRGSYLFEGVDQLAREIDSHF